MNELFTTPSDSRRTLTVVLPSALYSRAEATAHEAQVAFPDFVTDAVDGLAAMADAGIEAPPLEAPGGDPKLLRISVAPWVMERLDAMIARPETFPDRSSVVRAALAAHIGEVGSTISDAPKRSWAPAPAPSDHARVAPSVAWAPVLSANVGAQPAASGFAMPMPRPADDSARRNHRAHSRLESLADSRAMGKAGVPMESLLAPGDVSAIPARAPSEVQVGLSTELVARALSFAKLAELPVISEQRDGDLYGLTNRIAPTLWAAAQLVEMEVEQGGGPVSYGRFIQHVMPRAWDIGIGIEKWEGEQPRDKGSAGRGFQASARWPSPPRFVDDEERSARREASTVYGFVEYGLLTWTAGSSWTAPGKGWARGPLAALGLVAAHANADGSVWLEATRVGVEFLGETGRAGASCAYPHNRAAWAAYKEFLRSVNPIELDRMDGVLNAVALSHARKDLLDKVKVMDPEAMGSRNGPMNFANGYIARLREWGLLQLAQPKFGPKALTERGIAELSEAYEVGRIKD